MDLPVKFKERLQRSTDGTASGYPYQISADDLDKNFAFCAIDAPGGWIESASVGIHYSRKLKLPPIPLEKTYVLGCIDGVVRWMETQSC